MKTKSLFLVFSSLLFIFSCQEDKNEIRDPGKDIGTLHISKQKPQQGDTLYISYRHDNDNEGDFEGFYHYFVGPKSYPEDIELTDSAGVWSGRIVVPDSAITLAFNFQQDNKVLNNSKKGFVQPLYNNEGEFLKGSQASTGYFYQYLGGQYEVQSDSILAMIATDLEKNPELEAEWDGIYSYLLYASNKEKGEAFINRRIKHYSGKPSLTEEEFTTLASFYDITKNQKRKDSINKVVSEKYPAGKTAKRMHFEKFHRSGDIEEQERIFQEFQEKFGENPGGFENDYMLRMLAMHYAKISNWKEFEKYSGLIPDNNTKANTLNSIAWSLAEQEEHLEKAREISKQSLDLLKDSNEDDKPVYLTQKQFKNINDYSERMYMDTYALILFKQDNIEDALKYQEKAIGEGNNSEFNERYLQLLIANENFTEARDKAEKFWRNNTATAKAKDYYKVAFLQANGTEKELEKKWVELEKAGKNKALNNLKKEMINEEAAPFELVNLEGKNVSLNSLRGKTVILDFWATWCGPCTASFPGMQLVVDKYKDDKNVEFLFINTMENGEKRNEKVASFIKKKKYSFHVLMDQPKTEGSRKFKTASDYMVSGIPTKIIIGPDGKVNFKKVGYHGNNEEMAQEIDLMIELINAQEQEFSSLNKPVS